MKIKVKSLVDAKKILEKEKVLLTKNYGVSKIGIFGSFAFGDFSPKSDIDILIERSKNSKMSYFDLIDIEDKLSDKLGRKVDIVTKTSLKPYIKNDILKSVMYV